MRLGLHIALIVIRWPRQSKVRNQIAEIFKLRVSESANENEKSKNFVRVKFIATGLSRKLVLDVNLKE